MTTTLQAIAYKAHTHPKHRFRDLSPLMDERLLYESWGQLRKDAKPGLDGQTAKLFKQDLSSNVSKLARDLRSGRYRADRVKRTFIPKANGKQRPLGLPTVKDKLCQQGAVSILSSIWEQDFLPNSYGYRPRKSAHNAVLSLCANLQYSGYGYVVEADIKGFFDNVDHHWMMRMLKQRIDDKRLLSLIGQWLKAPIVENGKAAVKPTAGTPQGGVISPILANIYLHYALDLWFEQVVKPRTKGNAMMIRYCDDFVVAFQYRDDAERFYRVLPKRLNKFGLSVAPEKTQLLRFSRFHPGRRRCFTFLGFDFYWSKDRSGKARLRRRTATERQRSAMKAVTQWIKKNRHWKLSETMVGLRQRLEGFYNYFALTGNGASVSKFHHHTLHSLFKWLNRRSQRRSCNWNKLKQILSVYK